MYCEDMMNPANDSYYDNQTGDSNEKPFYYLF